ncbi:flagellar hook-associated protein FlgK [Heyndrickxia sporothermodurans]|uniref:flagellar hook-associated protein FlgK n=1 Tax=Heyndrickxia sporothermodurans TaxID=46224 RepID=UPI000D36F6AC|nr:flagellar hook-associated protein FlgK [Heyndrickxia sporothermodurans]PTY80439.1 flagellar hook-associated protein FlgK [Heyndrickxia sporothermodurans]
MRSTFFGLETAKRGMFTSQSAIYTTGNNISNANTPGYTRQRIEFIQTEGFPSPAMNRPEIPGLLGTGVKEGSIERIRDQFIDRQYRNENTKLGYWQSYAGSVQKMEEIMNEPSDYGLSKAMSQFWQSLQDLSVNPENEGARMVVLQRGQSLAETFNYLHDSLMSVRNELNHEMDVTVQQVNSLTTQLAAVNKQISEVEPHGYLPNDLYDQRDRLLDELSSIVPIETTYQTSGGKPSTKAEGTASINLVIGNKKISLVNGSNASALSIEKDEKGVSSISVNGEIATSNTDSLTGQGKLNALIQAYGTGEGKGLYPEMLDNLDKLAYTYASIFNEIHSKGYDKDGNGGVDANGNPLGKNFFEGLGTDYKGAAGSIKVADLKPSEIAASLVKGNAGNGGNAIALGNIKDLQFSNNSVTLSDGTKLENLEINNGTIQSFFEGTIGSMAVKGQQANRLAHNSEVLLNSVDKNRQSVTAVSLDEEFSNLIQFQHAYSASARMITAIDEMLDQIINGLGHVGK